jgi:ankyrin repeat protein
VIATTLRGWALVALLAAVCGCSAPDPRQVLVQLNVPYTTDAFIGQAGAGDMVAVPAFLAAGMNPNDKDAEGRTALMSAAAGGHADVVTLLLEKGATVNVTSARGLTPLAAAIFNDQPGVIALLIAKGARLNAPTADRHPLLLAIRARRTEAVSQLLDKGAKAYIQDHQWSALMMAAFIGDIGIVNALLSKDPNINSANDDGVTALMFAASAGHTPVVQALVSKGAAIDAKDGAGLTALMLAANNGHTQTTRVLLAAGAEPGTRNYTGGTARSLTSANGHTDIAALLPTPAPKPPPPPPAAATPLVQAERAERQSAADWRGLERRNFMTPDDRRLFDAAARDAWRYVVQQYQPSTGLIDATSGYAYTTVWDLASGMAALYCGHALQYLTAAEYDRRMGRVLATLQTIGLVDNAAFNKVYSTRTAAMVGRDRHASARGYGWSTTDLGRLLVWLKIIATTQPAHAAAATAIVRRLDFTRLVADGYMWGEDFDGAWKPRRYQEGQIGYEQYAAAGFAAWGADVTRALRLDENGLPITVMGHTLMADARGHDRLTSDPLVLAGLEMGWDAPTERLARALLGAQEARYRTTGRITMLGEDAINQPPHFFYYYGAYSHRQAFAVDVQARGAFVDEPRWVSAKAAFGWHALLPRAYTRRAMLAVAPARSAGGWGSGVFEGTSQSTGALNINTAAVILTAALVSRTGAPIMNAASSEAEPQ